MTIVILVIAALVLPLALLYLTLAVNDLEKNTRALEAILHKRYYFEPVKKSAYPAASTQSNVNPGKA